MKRSFGKYAVGTLLALTILFISGVSPMALAAPIQGGAGHEAVPARAQAQATPTRPPSSTTRTTLRLSGSNPTTLDPALAGDSTSSAFVIEIFGGLVYLDRNLRVQPDIAERWQLSEDGKTYTFYLRKDVRFHDGRPVTAADFKYSFERAADPALGSTTAETYLGDIVGVKDKLAKRASSVSGVRVIDDYTLEITVDAPKGYMLGKLTYPTAYVVDRSNVESGGKTWTDKPNGTGAYKLKEYVRDDRLVLVRNESFHLQPKPEVAQVEFNLGDQSDMNLYEKGQLDAIQIGRANIERARDPNSPLNKEFSTNIVLSTSYVVFNTRLAPFDDVKVRQAFALAIDRRQLWEVVYGKLPALANSILPPGMPGYVEPSPPVYDPGKAKQLLAESKYAGNLPEITWSTSGTSGSMPANVEAMTRMLRDNLGVQIAVQQTAWAAYLEQLNDPARRTAHIYSTGWVADYADPQNFIDVLFRTGGVENHSGYSNPQVDRLLDQAAVERDTAARFKLYQQIEQMILADYPVVPLTHTREYWLTKSYVKGMPYAPTHIPHLRYVWLADEVSATGPTPMPTLSAAAQPTPTLSGPPRRLDNAEVIKMDERGFGMNELTMTNNTNLDAVVVLTMDRAVAFAIYIRAHESYMWKLWEGTYEFYYMLGEDWDKDALKFTRKVEYHRRVGDQPLAFTRSYGGGYIYYTSWKPTLVAGSSVSWLPIIDASQFPPLK